MVNLKILWLIGLSLNSVLTLFKKYEDNYILVCEFALTLILSTPNPVSVDDGPLVANSRTDIANENQTPILEGRSYSRY